METLLAVSEADGKTQATSWAISIHFFPLSKQLGGGACECQETCHPEKTISKNLAVKESL
jgi:hypothetical protein